MPIVDSLALATRFELPPLEALAFFQSKGLKTTFAWQDMLGDEHDLAFTVAKMMDLDLLSTVRGKLDRALTNGKSLADFKRELIPELQKAGWWGKQDVVDPLTGQVVKAQLGSASRLETIFRTNLQSAYAVGRWQAIEDQAGTAPYLLYDAVDDHRTRHEHAALDGLVLKVDDPFWDTHAPSNGWNCRCGMIQLDDDNLQDYGLSKGQAPNLRTRKWQNPRTGNVHQVPTDLDPGWDHNPGKARYQQLKALAAEKAAAAAKVLADQRAAAKIAEAEAKIDAQVAAYKAKVAKLKADQPALKSKLKAQVQKLAQGELNHHLDAKTPYLAQAIKQLQGTKAGQAMPPAEQLAEAKHKALVIEQSAHLSGFKASSIKGNAVSAKQQAAFDALPDEAKASVLADIEVKSGVAEAKAELAQIAAGTAEKQAGLKKKLFLKWSKDGTLAQAANPKAALQAIEAEAAVLQAKAEKASALSGYKKNILEGKVPTPKQKQVFDALSLEAQAVFLAKLDVDKAAQVSKAEPKPDVTLEQATAAASASADVESPLPALDDLTQIGGQGGSNPGGLYQDINTGTRWYIKQPTNADQARNEVLTGKLYEAAGVEVPEMHWRDDARAVGVPATETPTVRISSKIIDGMDRDAAELKAGRISGVLDNFVVDAWLANWDVVGLGYDNLLVKQGRAIRIDTGAGLLYRAQGGPKGGNWNDAVSEIDSLRDAGLNPQAAAVFKHVTEDQLLAGARKVLAVDARTIETLVDTYGPGDASTKQALVKTLLARQATLARRFPEAVTEPEPAPAPPSMRVTEQELTDIKAARVNGVALATDKDQIEDQQVLIWHKQDVDGKPITGAYLKVRADAAQALNDQVVRASGGQPTLVSTAEVSSKIVTAIKGIAVQAKHGDPLRDKDVARIQSALAALDQVTADLDGVIAKHPGTKAAKNAQTAKDQLSAWSAAFQALKGAQVGDVASPVNGGAQFHSDQLIAEIKAPRKEQKTGGIPWKKAKNDYTLSSLDKSRQRDKSDTFSMSGHHYQAEIDGATLRYWPDMDGTRFALRGRLQIDTPGQGAGVSARTFAILDELGIDSARASSADQEALYLQRIAYRYKVDQAMNAAANTNAERRAWLEQQLGVGLSGAHYRPDGDHQAFSHGRRQQFDPVLQADPQWATFQRDYRLFHRITHGNFAETIGQILNGGAQMAPTADKMRRGGMSPDQDLNTGGAQYFFTRLFTATKAEQAGVGIVWRASRLARLDAISYSGDKFGETRGDHVRLHGKQGISELKKAASGQTNETLFKDSLSLFDDLDSIRAGSQRQEVIQLFKAAGYSEWPDGRSLEEVIKP